jgi:excisionase family DNA binding protein
MLSTRTNRIDPSLIPVEQLAALAQAFARPGHVRLTDSNGSSVELPEVLLEHLARIVRLMSERKAIVMVPEDEAFTTQAAANYLGMSRQHLVTLLDRGDIAHHLVGTHRRVKFNDLLSFERKRDDTRRAALDKLAAQVETAGLYDSDYAGEK